MKIKLAVRLTAFLLKRSDLNEADRNLLTGLVLDKLVALPLRDIITTNEEGTLLVSGQPLTYQQAVALRNSARAALESSVEKLIRDQVQYQSFLIGANNATQLEHLNFSKAAIWWGQQREKLLHLLAGDQSGTSPQED